MGEFADYAIDDIRVSDSDAPPPDTPLADAFYGYDALGRLAGQEVDGVKTWFVYDGDRVIEERDDTGALIASYYYGLYVDEVLRMDRGGQSYYFHQDDLYNVVAVSDINGALAERYEYGDYGLPEIYDPNGVPLDASAVGNPFLFTGRRWHPELQLYHYRTRFMDPVMGRFVSRDTIGLYGDPANLGNPNAYVGNNPWSRLDPWGRFGSYPYLHEDVRNSNEALRQGWQAIPAEHKVRAVGVVCVVGGFAEWLAGVALLVGGGGTEVLSGGTTSPVSIPAFFGGLAALAHGSDVIFTNWDQVCSGEVQRTYTSQTITSLTGSEMAGDTVDMGISLFAGGGAALKVSSMRGGALSVVDDGVRAVGDDVVSVADESVTRVTSPNAAARRSVQGEYVDPLTNQAVRTTETLAADHIIPQRVIKELNGFNSLTREQQAAVLNYADNFQGLPQTFNSSKGGTLPGEWIRYRGESLHPEYIARQQAIQPNILETLQEMIDSYIRVNGQR